MTNPLVNWTRFENMFLNMTMHCLLSQFNDKLNYKQCFQLSEPPCQKNQRVFLASLLQRWFLKFPGFFAALHWPTDLCDCWPSASCCSSAQNCQKAPWNWWPRVPWLRPLFLNSRHLEHSRVSTKSLIGGGRGKYLAVSDTHILVWQEIHRRPEPPYCPGNWHA